MFSEFFWCLIFTLQTWCWKRLSYRQWRTRGRGRRPPLRFEKFRANSVFRPSSSCPKILKDKKYFNTVKNIRANSVFQGKRRLFKIVNDKKYIFNTVNSGHTLFFRASKRFSKILNVKTIFNTVKNFKENSVFRASASSSKILISIMWKLSGKTLFFGASASCSKFWRIKNTFNTVNSGHTVFQGKQKLLKHPECKTYIKYSEQFHDKLCFQGKPQAAQKSWKIKNISTVKSFRATLFFRARKLFKNLNDKKSVTGRQRRQGREFLPYPNHEMCKTN